MAGAQEKREPVGNKHTGGTHRVSIQRISGKKSNSELSPSESILQLAPLTTCSTICTLVQPPQSTAPLALCSTTKRPYKQAPLAPAPVAPCTQPLNNMQLYTAPYGLQYAR